jgi:hypothetical protein
MNVSFMVLNELNNSIVELMLKWNNDPRLIPLIRPNLNKEDIEKRLSRNEIESRLKHGSVHLIYVDNKIVGEIGYQVDPPHLLKKEKGTA